MYLEVSGKPSRTDVKLCKDAVKFFGKVLLGETLYRKVCVRIEFKKFKPDSNDFAYCEWDFDNYRARDFTITVNKQLSKKQMMLALAHEMVHVKQYAKGELKDYLRVNKSKFKGVKYDWDEIDYWEYPWEIEAHGRERELYGRFLKKLRADSRVKQNKVK